MTRSNRSTRLNLRHSERKLSMLIEELSSFGDDNSMDLADRLSRCQQSRHERWLAYSRGKVQVSWPYRCRSAACWSCRRAVVARWKDRAACLFAGEQSGSCSFATIMVARIATLFPLQDVVVKLRRDLRNLRDGMARSRFTWNSVSLIGHVELDALQQSDIPLLPGNRREMVQSLPIIGGEPDAVAWIPHAHICIRHPQLRRSQIETAFAEQWRGAGRVHVEGFDLSRLAEDNAADCIGYGLKFRDTTMFSGGIILDWSSTWSAHFWSWLHARRRGLQPIQIALGARACLEDQDQDPAARMSLSYSEPMPVVL